MGTHSSLVYTATFYIILEKDKNKRCYISILKALTSAKWKVGEDIPGVGRGYSVYVSLVVILPSLWCLPDPYSSSSSSIL